MKYSEQGIIITRFSYSETSVMLKVFTKEHGLKSFLFQGAKKKKGVVLLPLSPIEFTCYQRDESHLAKMTDATLFYTFETIPFNPIKSTVVFFKVDILAHILHEGVKDVNLFDFILNELHWLDNNSTLANYPIYWLLELSKFIGFYPLVKNEKTPFFDLENGEFLGSHPNTFSYKSGIEVELLSSLVSMNKIEMINAPIPKEYRKRILQILLSYYHYHIPNFNEINSIEVIENIWE